MRTEEEIRATIIFLNGYIKGQEESYSENKESIKEAVIRVKALEWVLNENQEEQ